MGVVPPCFGLWQIEAACEKNRRLLLVMIDRARLIFDPAAVILAFACTNADVTGCVLDQGENPRGGYAVSIVEPFLAIGVAWLAEREIEIVQNRHLTLSMG
jgi:hypothetical protein